MLEEGSKPHPRDDHGQTGAVKPAWRASGLFASPWFPTGLAIATALALGAAILAAAASEFSRFPPLAPVLLENYWLLAAVSVLVCLGCGKEVQFTAFGHLIR